MNAFQFAVAICCLLPGVPQWGFFGHQRINQYAIFLLPPEMLVLYKPQAPYLIEHATDPDKRRYIVKEEGPRHYIDMDKYGSYPFDSLPRNWEAAVTKYGEDSLQAHGIAPWWIMVMHRRLVAAFKEGQAARILKISAEIGHYIADVHVPLHTSSNHNGQFSGQKGIHGFWESRIPELLADTQWEFLLGKATFLNQPSAFIWERILQSAAASDSVLKLEASLNSQFPADRKYAYEWRNGKVIRQYSSDYCRAYDRLLKGMIERRMQASVHAVASFWYTAWIEAGQPRLDKLSATSFSEEELREFEVLNKAWQTGAMKGREE